MFDVQKMLANNSRIVDVMAAQNWRKAGLSHGGQGGFDVSFVQGQVLVFSELKRDGFGGPIGQVWTCSTDAPVHDLFLGVKGSHYAPLEEVLERQVRQLARAVTRFVELGKLADVAGLAASLSLVGDLLLALGGGLLASDEREGGSGNTEDIESKGSVMRAIKGGQT